MPVKQITVFLENKCGRLASVTRVIGDQGINIRAFSVADTTDFGILRLIVNEPDRAYEALRKANFTVRMTEVIAVQIPDRPGGLADVLDLMQEAGINIEYMYAFVAQVSGDALAVFRVENTRVAEQLMLGKGIKVLSGEEVYNL
ncbi:amino acid-binding protein [Thermacetogenium phaeum DSM 12270]|uniref:Amino acid-binding protein n=1 Tax=Thermacetogenium phaeum (strain ATCC BAA-254 / DSM 26808 / PB) TaxID=1089553 RepID=K4LF48_THEPS|nr:ACT domain-containing protein [Thermacetogenium phaeum]AFV11473.1 amino acid-binding protein [Thermacetogenium phaeum DSM 12270]